MINIYQLVVILILVFDRLIDIKLSCTIMIGISFFFLLSAICSPSCSSINDINIKKNVELNV